MARDAKAGGNLIAGIERDALNDRVPLVTTLRKCVVLGCRTGFV